MCGIFGYLGKNAAVHRILLHGLERLEYRGYDSAGICVANEHEHITIKAVGKVSEVSKKVQALVPADSQFTIGIAHTRWATHGGTTEENTHPHTDMHKRFTIVHNGIIENYHKIKQSLLAKGYVFYGETDTEVVANLLSENRTGNFLETVQKTLPELRGAYALLIMCQDAPDEMIAVKIGSPLLFGYNNDGSFFFSSDKQALAGYVEKIIYLDDGELAHMKNNEYLVMAGNIAVRKSPEHMDVTLLESSKGQFAHFMEKEIFEQPAILKRICKGRVHFDTMTLNADAFHGMSEESFEKIVFIGCGTSYNAGWLGSYRIQDLVGVESSAEIASEYEYKPLHINEKTLYVFISQSGETADSIAVLKNIKEKGGKTFGVVNVPGSTIARLTDHGLFTRAGTEIGVASTKAFTAQLSCILLLALFLGKKRNLSQAKYEKILTELEKIPGYMEQIFDTRDHIKQIAKDVVGYRDFFFLGRHFMLPIAYESSLKFKEITYLHSEAYATGELKHGPLALIDEHTPSIIFMPSDEMYEKNNSGLHEVQSRKGKTLIIGDQVSPQTDWYIPCPKTISELYPFLGAVIGQLLSYEVAALLGNDIDKPRNLAKSVTVK